MGDKCRVVGCKRDAETEWEPLMNLHGSPVPVCWHHFKLRLWWYRGYFFAGTRTDGWRWSSDRQLSYSDRMEMGIGTLPDWLYQGIILIVISSVFTWVCAAVWKPILKGMVTLAALAVNPSGGVDIERVRLLRVDRSNPLTNDWQYYTDENRGESVVFYRVSFPKFKPIGEPIVIMGLIGLTTMFTTAEERLLKEWGIRHQEDIIGILPPYGLIYSLRWYLSARYYNWQSERYAKQLKKLGK